MNSRHRKSIKRQNFKSTKEFQIEYLIDKGAFSQVYLAQHIQSKKFFALKKIQIAQLNDIHKKTLHKEIEIHGIMKHKNIVKFYGHFEEDNNVFIVLEYCKDGTLYKHMKSKKRLRTKQIIDIFHQVIDAVKYIHNKKVILRDLKPENILIQKDEIKLCDFGWSTFLNDHEWNQRQAGTPIYMSPEALKGEQQSFKSDIWSLGILLYELFYSKEPYQGEGCLDVFQSITQEQINFKERDIPLTAKNLIKTLLNFDPQKRPSLENIYQNPFLIRKKIEEQKSVSRKPNKQQKQSFQVVKVKNHQNMFRKTQVQNVIQIDKVQVLTDRHPNQFIKQDSELQPQNDQKTQRIINRKDAIKKEYKMSLRNPRSISNKKLILEKNEKKKEKSKSLFNNSYKRFQKQNFGKSLQNSANQGTEINLYEKYSKVPIMSAKRNMVVFPVDHFYRYKKQDQDFLNFKIKNRVVLEFSNMQINLQIQYTFQIQNHNLIMNSKEQLSHSITSQKIQRNSSNYQPQNYVRKYYPDEVIYGPSNEYQLPKTQNIQSTFQTTSTRFPKNSQPKTTSKFQQQNQNFGHLTGSVREMTRSIPFNYNTQSSLRQAEIPKVTTQSITVQQGKKLKDNMNWEAEAKKWKIMYQDLEKRMDILTKTKNQTQVEYELSNQLDRKTQEIVDLRNQIEDLKQQVTFKSFDESILFSNDVLKLKERIKELMIELQKKPKLIKVEKIEKYNEKYEPADMARIIDEEKNKNQNLEKQVQTMRREIQDKDNIIRQNKQQIEQLERRAPNTFELDNLRSQINDYQDKLNDKVKSIGTEKANNFQLNKEIGNLQNEINNLKRKQQLDQSNQEYQLRNKDQKINDLENALKLKDLEINQLQNRQNQQKPEKYQVDNNLNSALDKIKREQDRLLQEKNNMIEDLRKLLNQQEQKARDLENDNNYNQSKIDRLERELKNQPQPSRFDSDALEKRVYSLQQQNQDSQNENDRLKKRNQELDDERFDLQRQINDLKNQLKNTSPDNERRLQDQIRDKDMNEQKLIKEIQILKDEIREKNDMNTNNNDDRNHLKDQLREERKNNDDLHDQLNDMKRKHKNKIRNLEDEIEELQNQMKKNKFTDEFKSQLLQSINPQQGYHKEHIKEIIEKSSNNNNKDLEGTLKDIFYAIKELNLRKEPENTNKPFLQDLNQTRYKDEDVLDMKIDLKDLKSQNDQLKDKLEKADQKGQKLKDQLKELKDKNTYLEKQVNQQSNQIKETKEYREVLVPEKRETKDENSELVPKLQNEIQQLKQENERLKGLEEDWRKMLRKKKKALLNELSNFVNSKNNFENSFYNELTKPTPAN